MKILKKATFASLLIVGFGGLGCGSETIPDDETTCPSGQPIRCPDSSCAESMELCEAPTPVTARLVGVSARSVLAARPEPIEFRLQVDDLDELESQLADGGVFEVDFSTPFGTSTFEATPTGEPDSAEMIGNYNFRIEIGPEAQSGPMRGEVNIRYVAPGGAEKHVGTERVHFRGEPSSLEFPTRSAQKLEGAIAPTRAWAPDLDGDGFRDAVLLDVDAEGADLLRLYRCDAERCEPASERSLSSSNVVVHHSRRADEAGFLVAAPQLGEDGSVLTVDCVHFSIDPNGNVDETNATINLAELPGLQLSSLQPRLLTDGAGGDTRPGLTVQQRVTAREVIWSTLTLDETGIVRQQEEYRTPPGEEPELFSALQTSTFTQCHQGEMNLDLAGKELGIVMMPFQSADGPELIFGSTDAQIGPLGRIPLDGVWDSTAGAIGSVECRLADLDGDGELDVVAALSGEGTFDGLVALEDRRARLVTMRLTTGTSSAVIPGTPSLVGDVAADSWKLTEGESSWFLTTKHELSGQERVTRVELEPCAECDELSLEASTIPPSIQGIEITSPTEPATIAAINGDNVVVRKKPGRKTYRASSSNGGSITSTSQVITTDGTWVVARYGEGLRPTPEGPAAFGMDGGGSVFGFLPNNGEFVELRSSEDGNSPLHEATSVEGESVLYEMSQSDTGDTTITAWDLDATAELRLNDNPVVFEIAGAEAKNVVKFKAGAELSKSIAAPDGDDDCNDEDTCPRPGTFVAVQFDDGEVATSTLNLGEETATPFASAPLNGELTRILEGTPDATDLWVGDLGAGPVALLRGSLDDRAAIVGITAEGDAFEFVAESGNSLDIARSKGTETSQIVTCRLSAGESYCDELSMGTDGSFDAVRWMAPESLGGRVTNVLDIDGDDCADIVVDSTTLVSSRCGLGFAAPTTLGSWGAHLAAAPATSHNAARSNRSQGGITDSDNNDGSHAVTGAFPFFDGVEASY